MKSKATDGALDEKALRKAMKVYNASLEDEHFLGATRRIVSAYLAALPPPTGEPVAWQWRRRTKDGKWHGWVDAHEDTVASKASENRADIETRALFAAPLQVEPAKCPSCKGSGTEADYVGDDMRCVETGCSKCGGTGLAPQVEPAEGEIGANTSPAVLRGLYQTALTEIVSLNAALLSLRRKVEEQRSLILDAYKGILVLKTMCKKEGFSGATEASDQLIARMTEAMPELPGLSALRARALAGDRPQQENQS